MVMMVMKVMKVMLKMTTGRLNARFRINLIISTAHFKADER